MVITRPQPSGPGKGKLNPEGPWVLQLGTSDPERRAALETRTSWVNRQVTSGTSGSLSANMGRFLPGALSHWLQGASGQIGICPGKAPAGQPMSAARAGGTGVPAKRLRCPRTPAPEDSCTQRELVTLLKLKRVISHVVK